jgi:NitT/TauT family transport system permease protein
MPIRSLEKSPEERRRFGVLDAAIFLFVVSLLYLFLVLGRGAAVPFRPELFQRLDLSPAALPYYAGRSLLRMFIAFWLSLFFSVIYGYWAASSRRAERVLIPLLDILQSVPVLGFLAATITAFIALFPGSLLGLECASIFAVFTSQAWNMTLSFYQSMTELPADLRDSAAMLRLTWSQRFSRLYLPNAATGLIWNGMISFGASWFFLAASEALTLQGRQVLLPGIGSYVAEAVREGDSMAMGLAILTMVIIIVALDQLVWKPVTAWGSKFRTATSHPIEEPSSIILLALRRSALVEWASEGARRHLAEPAGRTLWRIEAAAQQPGPISALANGLRRLPLVAATLGVLLLAAWSALHLPEMLAGVPWHLPLHLFLLGLLSMLRVWAMVILATLVWLPVGVWIGQNPRVALHAQPLVTLGASFPVNLIFPAMMFIFLKIGLSINYGSILLMGLAAQWYILSNVIVGALLMSPELKEAAAAFGLGRWQRWRRLILPSVFPYWLTGAIAAAGGAWNATIVAEMVSWGDRVYVARGLGSYIVEATATGNRPALLLSISVMSILVIANNRLIWRRLYRPGQWEAVAGPT